MVEINLTSSNISNTKSNQEIIVDIINGYTPTIEELTNILRDEEITEYLTNTADSFRKHYAGDEIYLRAIIEFSNYCKCKCLYCGLNCDNHNIKRYRMPVEEIIDVAKEAIDAGYGSIVFQSGEDPWYTVEKLCTIAKEVKKYKDVGVTMSVGERTYEEYDKLKAAGCDRFLLKHETADEKIYNYLHPHSNFQERIRCLKALKSSGYQVGSGFMIGLPNQTYETIAKDILLLKELDVSMAGIGPFISHKDTELKDISNGSPELTLKAVALVRILVKDINLPATTSLETIDKDKRNRIFNCGANVIMKKVEPYKYRRLYEIYPKELGEEKSIKEERLQLEEFIKSLGRTVSSNKGDLVK